MSSEPEVNSSVSIKSGRTKFFPKDKVGLFGPDQSVLHKDLDPACLFDFENPLVRIEYPGCVKNPDRAIATLGGMEEIQKALEQNKLQLSFHPDSEFTKGCVGDLDTTVGFLLKVKKNTVTKEVSYEVVGACDRNFKFNRMCDFQFLPLLAKEKPEHKECDVDYMHNKFVLDRIPTMDWFNKKEKGQLFLTCGSFARFDLPQVQFKSNSYEKFNSMIRSDSAPIPDPSKKSVKEKCTVNSIRTVMKENTEIPTEPAPLVFDIIKSKMLQKGYEAVKKLYEERPIWTKSGVLHKANLSSETAKYVLPAVAYYALSGPWRTCWIKLGYNPMTDYNSRIYQVLDFRIKHSEGMQMKIKAKATTTRKISSHFQNMSVAADHYILRPNQIPLARQLSYQYCDIWLPEVQEMLSKLPKLPSILKYDQKNGWLPLNFQEQCREKVNKYIFEAVQKEIINESKRQQETKKPDNVTAFCSQMLNTIKKKGLPQMSGIRPTTVEHVDLGDSDEEIDVNDLMDSLPETLGDEGESDSDMEIDPEALEEVNKIVSGVKENDFTL